MNTNTAELIIERIEPEQDEALKEVQILLATALRKS